MNPADKRLAVTVEDHPLDYGSFEGTIPEGQYGAGRVIIWDSGTFTLISGSLAAGKIEFDLKGKKLRGAFVLFRMKGKEREWLLVKKKGAPIQRCLKGPIQKDPSVDKALQQK